MTVKRVIFIRPGETDWNRDARWQGWVASPLNQHGRQQALALAKYIRNIGVSALYTSDLVRAIQTAHILAERLGYAPILDPRWRERDIGKWQGMTQDEMRLWYADDFQRLQADVENFRVPGGESRADVRKRVGEAFASILREDKGSTVGVISHTTATHLLLESIIPNYDVYGSVLGNTSVTTIALAESGQWEIVTANDVAHLEGLASRSFGEVEEVEEGVK
jgi:probable phosphoglycerate mutase